MMKIPVIMGMLMSIPVCFVRSQIPENGGGPAAGLNPGACFNPGTVLSFNPGTIHSPIAGWCENVDTARKPPVPDTGDTIRKPVQLKEVVVSGKKRMIEHNADRVVVHVDALLSNTGTNTLEVLGNTPGLQVDDEGTIALHGRTGVRIFVDGRPTQLTGADLAAYLRSLPSGMLDRIELFTNPPARFDAAGTGGVINIITKSSNKAGLTGSVTGNTGAGVYGSSNNSLYINYRRGRWKLSGNAGLSVQNSFFHSDRSRTFFHPDGSPDGSLVQTYLEHSNQTPFTFALDGSYELSKKNKLEASFSGLLNPYNEWGDYRTNYLGSTALPDSVMRVASHLQNTWRTAGIHTGFRHGYDEENASLSAGIDYYSNHLFQHQVLATFVSAPDGHLLHTDELLPRQPYDLDEGSVQLDFAHPLGKRRMDGGTSETGKLPQLETGWKTDYMAINSLAEFATRPDAHAAIDSSWSTRFLYRQTIHAVYGNLSRQWGQLTAQAGLRVETTLSRGKAPAGAFGGQDTAFRRVYTDLFPTLYLSYRSDSQATHQLSLSAGRRIDRPDPSQLSPSRFYFDRVTIYSGNPALLPAFSYSAELSHTYKQNLMTSVSFSDYRNMTLQTFNQQGSVLLMVPVNVGRILTWEVNSGVSLPFRSWWTVILYAEWVSNRPRVSEAYGQPVNSLGQYLRVTMNNQFRLGNGWNAELSGFYRTGYTQLQSIARPYWYVNATIQKKLWNNRWTANLAWRDIFYSKVYGRSFNKMIGQTLDITNRSDSRVASLSLTYRFGRSDTGKKGKEKTDVKSEIERLRNSK